MSDRPKVVNPVMKLLSDTDSAIGRETIFADNIKELQSLFPEIVTDGKINFDTLRELLNGRVDESDEKYGLNWHGKRRARQLALLPSSGTLRPIQSESVDWATTQNIVIEGDNLEVLKLLQKSYASRVKLIFIDPPYNTGGDFVYPDNYKDSIQNYLEITGQAGEAGKKISSNKEVSGRFHTDWLNMIYPRLKVARNLLRDDGALFVTIDDHEVQNLRAIMNELFGEENFVAQVEWQKRYTRSNNTDDFTSVIDHVCIYQKTDAFRVNLLKRDEAADARFTNPDNDPRGPWKATPFLNQVSPERRPNLCYPIKNPKTGRVTNPDKKAWRYERKVFDKLSADQRLYWGKEGNRDVPDIKTFLSEVRKGMTPINFWSHQYAGNTDIANREIKELFGEKVFDTPKPVLLIQRILEHGTEGAGDIVLDFFAGSGSTGHATLAQNAIDGGTRRYILIQLPEPLDPTNGSQKAAADFCDRIGVARNIAELTKERARRVANVLRETNPLFLGDVGFRVFRLDSTNLRSWDPHPENLEQTLLESVQHIKADRTDQDILYEIILRLGLDLSAKVEVREISEMSVYAVNSGNLIACLTQQIPAKSIPLLAKGVVEWWQDLGRNDETVVVFRDDSFSDDVSKTNLVAILNQHGLETVRSL